MLETSLSLLDRLRQSPEDADWSRLIDAYSPLLRAWMMRAEVQAADADDLVQEVLLVVHRELPKFEHNQRRGAFRNWLRQIVVHRLRNFWRSRGRLIAAGSDSRAGDDRIAVHRIDSASLSPTGRGRSGCGLGRGRDGPVAECHLHGEVSRAA
ncbi:MAG: RNA polymerase sigma-70 factor ECF subfamily [Planctomycetota bacterium]|nr:MAG: RNA polymerase sigma-70 factor ECF subfamily [Planctomycetota bacterium]